jgi:predicted permease
MLQDLKYGLRALARNPTITVVAVLSLALGVGANTTIFTLVNAVLLRPLPVDHPSTLAAVHTVDPRNPGMLLCSYPNYLDYRDRNSVFSSLLLHTVVTVNLAGHGDPQLLMGQLVSGNYFSTLGVQPVVGRGFVPEEDGAPGANPVAVIAYGLWSGQFGGDPQITSRTINLNGYPFRIVGVAPPEFHGLNELYAADLWAPVAMYQQLYPNAPMVNQRRYLGFSVAGRLKPGVGWAQAEVSLRSIARDLEREYPKDNAGRTVRLASVSDAALAPKTRTLAASAGVVLMFISACVLMIASANVANLLLARALRRNKEITVRLAVGASRWRLARQLLMESLLLSIAGGAAGLAFAGWVRDLLWSMRPPMFRHSGAHPDLDLRVMGYSLAVSILTGLLFGLVPALRATRGDLATDLKERSGQAAGTFRIFGARSMMLASQVAFSLIALVGAGLFVRSVQNASQINAGFDAYRLGFVAFNLGEQGYTEARGREFQNRALKAVSATPGVSSAALAKDVAFHVSMARTVLMQGQENSQTGIGRFTLTSVVGPGYFRTVGVPILRGRDFTALDTQSTPLAAIVNEVAAASFWPGQNPLGQVLHFSGDTRAAEVVGVVRRTDYQALGEDPQALIYLSLEQYYFPTAVVYVRTAGDPEAVAAAARRAIQLLDRNLVLQSESVGRTIRESLWAQRISAWLLTVFGGLALLLATIGIYGVVSFTMNQRVREIGVRMALGATVAQVRTMVLLDGFRPVAVGVVAGTLAALPAASAVRGMLFLNPARDALMFVGVPFCIVVVAILACWVPAVRATRIDPAKALRDE